MLFWWMGTDVTFDMWLHGSATIVGMGVIATFLRYLHRISPPRNKPKPFTPRRSGYKTPANDNQLVAFSLHVKRKLARSLGHWRLGCGASEACAPPTPSAPAVRDSTLVTWYPSL